MELGHGVEGPVPHQPGGHVPGKDGLERLLVENVLPVGGDERGQVPGLQVALDDAEAHLTPPAPTSTSTRRRPGIASSFSRTILANSATSNAFR